jgi:hypothetical protein
MCVVHKRKELAFSTILVCWKTIHPGLFRMYSVARFLRALSMVMNRKIVPLKNTFRGLYIVRLVKMTHFGSILTRCQPTWSEDEPWAFERQKRKILTTAAELCVRLASKCMDHRVCIRVLHWSFRERKPTSANCSDLYCDSSKPASQFG